MTINHNGLHAYVGNEIVEVLTEHELYENAISVLPTLCAMKARPYFRGPHWTSKGNKDRVQVFEFDSHIAQMMTENGATEISAHPLANGLEANVSYAVVAQCDLDCHLMEVMDALFKENHLQFESSMNIIWDNKIKHSDMLLSRQFQGTSHTSLHSGQHLVDMCGPSNLTVKSAAIRPHSRLQWTRREKNKLCYSSYTQRSPSKNEAFHVFKTLPCAVHDIVTNGSSHIALSSTNNNNTGVDHIAAGYYLRGIFSEHGGHRTKVLLCTYVSNVSTEESESNPQCENRSTSMWDSLRSQPGSSRNAAAVEARYILNILINATREFQRVIRRRRFGIHHFKTNVNRTSIKHYEPHCIVCEKSFGWLRKNYFCQLCSHLVCIKCSRNCDVDVKSSHNRVCFPCAAQIDGTVLGQRNLDLGSRCSSTTRTESKTNISSSDVNDCEGERCAPSLCDRINKVKSFGNSKRNTRVLEHAEHDYGDYGSPTSTTSTHSRSELYLAEELFSPIPSKRISALEALSSAVQSTRRYSTSSAVPPSPRMMDSMVLRKYHEEKFRESTAPIQHYTLYYPHPALSGGSNFLRTIGEQDGHKVAPQSKKDQCRGFKNRAALDSICENVANCMNCCTVFITIIEDEQQHLVSKFENPGVTYQLQRDSHIQPPLLVSCTEPLVSFNAMRDVRLSSNPLIKHKHIQFYAHFPLKKRNGTILGSLVVMDTEARDTIHQDDFAALLRYCRLAVKTIRKGQTVNSVSCSVNM